MPPAADDAIAPASVRADRPGERCVWSNGEPLRDDGRPASIVGAGAGLGGGAGAG